MQKSGLAWKVYAFLYDFLKKGTLYEYKVDWQNNTKKVTRTNIPSHLLGQFASDRTTLQARRIDAG